ncbi:hypothetical protein MTO96_052241 [Rhipicephalus appendiculatus]
MSRQRLEAHSVTERGSESRSSQVQQQQQPVYTCRFCLGSDNQMSMVMPCNCKGNFSHAHANCVAIQIYQNRVYACHICHYDFNIRWDNQKSFVDWLLDSDNVADHVLFVLSVLFTLSLVLVLTLYRKAYLIWKVQSPPPALRHRLESQATASSGRR